MKQINNIERIGKRSTGNGHYQVTLYMKDGSKVVDTVTDMQAIDAWDEQTENYPNTGKMHLAERILWKDSI